MASSVLVKAFMDWKSYGHKANLKLGDKAYAYDIRNRFGFASPREELTAFFLSDWCQFLLAGFPVDYGVMMEALVRQGFGVSVLQDEQDVV